MTDMFTSTGFTLMLLDAGTLYVGSLGNSHFLGTHGDGTGCPHPLSMKIAKINADIVFTALYPLDERLHTLFWLA